MTAIVKKRTYFQIYLFHMLTKLCNYLSFVNKRFVFWMTINRSGLISQLKTYYSLAEFDCLGFFFFMSSSCYFRSVEIVIELGIIVFFQFSAEKKVRPNCAFWDTCKLLRCLNSKEIKLQNSIRGICILLDLVSVQLKIQKKTKITSSTTISTRRI